MTTSARTLPSGTLTFVFTDIEGSTRLVNALGSAFGPVLERHHALLREAFEAQGGVEVSTEGDAFFVVFTSAPAAVVAAAAAQRALARETWPPEAGPLRVRMGMHTGEGALGADNYIGLDVHRGARIASAAHGGQVLLSATTQALVAGSLPGDLRLRDLGEFRLKDLEQAERLVQLVVPGLQEDFPPPRTLEVPSNLPVQVTTFVGRDREIGEITALLRRSRLVTLTGPGGTGKTRLCLQVAERSQPEHPAGVYFVELAPISEAGLIPTTVAQAIGVREEATRPILESLEAHLRDLHLLLVLDNFEQLVEGAPLVGRLLDVARNLTVMVTSREVLHLRGEQEYPVPPLQVPDARASLSPEALSRFDAVTLFVQRAQAVRPEFALDTGNARAVAAICARLDGLPLAIELAAARSKLFAPEAILARLEKSLALLTAGARDVPERQRTLRGAIDWSYNLLDPPEQALFRRLAVFVGGCTVESAQAVCDPDGELGIDVLDALSSLVDKSLLRTTLADGGEPRFHLLTTIREYGRECLAARDEAAPVARRYEEHFAALAEEAEQQMQGGRQKAWLDRLDVERDNLRSALQRAADDGRMELALGMGAALWRFWQQRGHLAEGRESLGALLARPAATGPTAARARALAGLGGIAYWQADIAAAGTAYAEALAIERTQDDPSGLAEALYNAGFVLALTGDHAGAQADYEEAASIYEAIGDHAGLNRLREALVFLMFHQAKFAEARALQEQNVAAFRDAGNPQRVANALMLLSAIHLKAGTFDRAHDALSEACGMFRRAGDQLGRVLRPAGWLSISEQAGDPEHLSPAALQAEVEPVGFELAELYRRRLSYTATFRRRTAPS